MTTSVSLRLPVEFLAQLRTLAHRKSLQEGREVRWTDLLKQIVAEHLNAESKGLTP
jgi:hypothetical protein